MKRIHKEILSGSIALLILVGGLVFLLGGWERPVSSRQTLPAAFKRPALAVSQPDVMVQLFTDYTDPQAALVVAQVLSPQFSVPDSTYIELRDAGSKPGTLARLAAMAVLAAQVQDRGVPMARLLAENSGALEPARVLSLAQLAGLDMQQFKRDLDHPDLNQKVEFDTITLTGEGDLAGLIAYVNGVRLVNPTAESLAGAIADQHALVAEYIEAGGEPEDARESLMFKNGAPRAIIDLVKLTLEE